MSKTLDDRRRKQKGGELHYFFVPDAFDPAIHLPYDLQPYADCARYLLDRIVSGTCMRRGNEDGYVNLVATHLRHVTPNRVEKPIRKALVDAGVIQCDGHYIIGEKAMGYRFAPGFGRSHRVLCSDEKVAARISSLNRKPFRTDVTLPVHRYLRNWLDNIEIDMDRAEDIILGSHDLSRQADRWTTTARMIAAKHFN